jgi:hypothetical protein
MQPVYQKRPLTPKESQVLQKLAAKKRGGPGAHIKYYHFVIAAILGAGFTWLAMLTEDSFWVLPFGTFAVFSFAFIVFMPYEIYQWRKKQQHTLKQYQAFLQRGAVDTFQVHATQIALAEEYEDEGDLYIVACNSGQILYLWDTDYTMRKNFPCLEFELYESDFAVLFGRQINPLSNRVTPVMIDKTAKWNYMSQVGVPEHMEMEPGNFDTILETIQRCGDKHNTIHKPLNGG